MNSDGTIEERWKEREGIDFQFVQRCGYFVRCLKCLQESDRFDDFESHGCPGAPEEPDRVNHPKHYTAGGIEVLDIFKAKLTPEEYRGALKANVLKYLFREGLKGKPLEDLKKAQFYLNLLVENETPDPSPFPSPYCL